MSVRPPPWQTVSMPPAGASKWSNLVVAAPSPVVACALRRSIAVAIQLRTAITRAVSRNKKVHCLSVQLSNQPAATIHEFRNATESAPANERAEEMGRRAPTRQIVRRMGAKGLTLPFLSSECVCTYVIPINQIRILFRRIGVPDVAVEPSPTPRA